MSYLEDVAPVLTVVANYASVVVFLHYNHLSSAVINRSVKNINFAKSTNEKKNENLSY